MPSPPRVNGLKPETELLLSTTTDKYPPTHIMLVVQQASIFHTCEYLGQQGVPGMNVDST